MKRWLSVSVAIALSAGLGFAIASCKQSEGDRCEADSDCEPGLTCSQAEHVCSSGENNQGEIDAPIDNPPMEAAVDML